jgi:flagellar basal body rod protein FlgC
MTTQLYYVALSRVTSLNGLYLYSEEPNRNSILTTRIKNKSKQEKLISVAENMKNNRGRQELLRMRNYSRLEDRFSMLTIQKKSLFSDSTTLNVMFHNICNQHTNLTKIEKDFAYKNSDIIFLVETHCNLDYKSQIFLNDFDVVCLTGTREKNSSNGQTCFIKKCLRNNIQLIAHNANPINDEYEGSELTKIVELSLFKYMCHITKNQIFFCSLYKHPKVNNDTLYSQLAEFLSKYLVKDYGSSVKLYLFGDFNIPDSSAQSTLMTNIFHICGLVTTITNVSTHADGNQLDWCFTNKINTDKIFENTILYESWYSDHSGLLTTIDLKK